MSKRASLIFLMSKAVRLSLGNMSEQPISLYAVIFMIFMMILICFQEV